MITICKNVYIYSNQDLKYAEYLYKRQCSTYMNHIPMTPLIREYNSEHFNIFVNNTESLLLNDFKYSLNIANENDLEAIEEEMAVQFHLDQIYSTSGLNSEFSRKIVMKGKELGGIGGLSSLDADELLHYSSDSKLNEFEPIKPIGSWIIIIKDIFRQNIFISIGTIILLLLLNEWIGFLYILFLIFFIISFRLYYEKNISFNNLLMTLENYTVSMVTVKRNNVWQIMDSSLLVKGDLILLEGL